MAQRGRVARPHPSFCGAAASQECLRGLKFLLLADSAEVQNRLKLLSPNARAEWWTSTLLRCPSEASVS